MRVAAWLLVALLAYPVLPGQAALETGPHPAGNAHFASDGQHTLDESTLLSPTPYGLTPNADHVITVTLADYPLLDRSSVRLVYGVEGRDPATQGTQVPMLHTGTTGSGDLRFTAILRPNDLQGPTAAAESLVRFFIKYRLPTEQIDDGGQGYAYVRDSSGPRALGLTLDDQATRSIAPGATTAVRVQLTDASVIQAAALDIIADGTLYSTLSLNQAGHGQWSATLESQNLPRGLYSLRVRATDTAGNAAATTFTDRLVIGSQNPTAVPGASHTARDASHILQQHHLAGPTRGGLNRLEAHTITVHLENTLPARVLDVRLHYTVDDTPASISRPGVPMALSAAGASYNAFTATLAPADRLASFDESTLRFIISVSSAYFPSRTDDNNANGYAYIDDGRGPSLGEPLFNGRPTYAGSSDASVSIRIPTQDASPLDASRLNLVADGAVVRSISLTPATGAAVAALPNGLGVPRGAYDFQVVVQDGAGNPTSLDVLDAIHIADGPPAATEGSDAVTVTAGNRLLREDQLRDGTPALDGLVPHQFQLRIEAPQDGEDLVVDVQYDPLGAAPGTGSSRLRMQRSNASDDAWTYQAQASPSTLRSTGADEHPVAFRFLIQSSLFGTRIEPDSGFYHYLWDAQAPRIQAPTINNHAAAVAKPTTPLEVEATIRDAGGVAQAMWQVMDGSQVVLERTLLGTGDLRSVSLPSGAGLPTGTYDVRILATDDAGHETAPFVVAGALRISTAAPGILSVAFNDAARIEVSRDTPIEAVVAVQEGAATGVSIALVDTQGVAIKTLQLEQRDAATWAKVLSSGVQLPSGSYKARATVLDAAGNQEQFTTSHPAVVVDAAPPTIYTDRIDYALGTKQAARVGDAVTIQVGVADANTVRSVQLQTPGGLVEMQHTGGVLYRHTLQAPASNGPATYTVKAIDEAGNMGTGAVLVRLDSQPPSIPQADVLYEANMGGTVTTGDAVRIAAVATDQHTSVQRVLVDATKVNNVAQVVDLEHAPSSTAWETTIQILAPAGTYSLPVIALDEAGNKATRSLSVVVRNEGPAITQLLLNGRDALNIRPGAPIRIEAHLATDQAATVNATVTSLTGLQEADVALTKTGPRTYAATLAVPLPEGRHRVAGLARDAQERSAAYEDSDGRLVVDGTAPRLLDFTVDTGVSSPNATRPKALFGSPISLAAGISDLSAVNVTVTATGNGNQRTSTELLDAAATQTYTGTLDLFALGTHTLRLLARDAVGFTTEAVRDVDVIPAGPRVPGAVENLRVTGDAGAARPNFAWDPPVGGAVGYVVAVDAEPGVDMSTRQNNHQVPSALAAGSHVVRVRAVSQDGNPGPIAELAFAVAATQATGAAGSPPLSSPGTAGQVNASPGLSWSVNSPEARCTQIQASINGAAFVDVEPCTTATHTDALAQLQAGDGDNVTVRGRLIYDDNTTGSWQQLAQYRVDTRPPDDQAATTSASGNRTLSLAVTGPAGDATKAVALIYDAKGSLVARVPLSSLGNGSFVSTYQVPSDGTYTVRYEVQDAAGNLHTAEDQVRVDGSSRGSEQGSRSLWVAVLAGGAAATAGAVLWFMRRRKIKAPEAPPPVQPPPAPTPRRGPETAPVLEATPVEERGIETSGAATQRRALAAQDRAGVGPEGNIQLYKA